MRVSGAFSLGTKRYMRLCPSSLPVTFIIINLRIDTLRFASFFERGCVCRGEKKYDFGDFVCRVVWIRFLAKKSVNFSVDDGISTIDAKNIFVG